MDSKEAQNGTEPPDSGRTGRVQCLKRPGADESPTTLITQRLLSGEATAKT